MNPATAIPAVQPRTLDLPDARLHYELRGQGPLLVLLGAPMDATSFAPLADRLAGDFTVLTTDPRGINRSSVADPALDSTPEMRADDVSRLIVEVGAGRASVFGSSGGAVTALALAHAHPEQVDAVVAHEPPLIELLDDRDAQRANVEGYVATYLRGDVVCAWRQFFAAADIAIPDEAVEAMFGGRRDPQALADERFWFAHELRPSSFWRPDLDALRDGPVRLIVGVGEGSAGQECDRTSAALATGIGTERVVFPGGHIGFVDQLDAFASRLSDVLGHPPS